MKYLFTKLNIRKEAGPDNISPSTLMFCAEQLAPIFCEIYNHSLSPCKVPTCFKSSTIIPVPQNPKVSSLNDYRPVALTSIVMKDSFKFLDTTIANTLKWDISAEIIAKEDQQRMFLRKC